MSETLRTIAHWHRTYRKHSGNDCSSVKLTDPDGAVYCEAAISHEGAAECCDKLQVFVNLIATMSTCDEAQGGELAAAAMLDELILLARSVG